MEVAIDDASKAKWWILVISCFTVLLTGVDATAVNIILAPLSAQLHVSIAKLQWVMNAYLLIYAACLIVGGRIGDIFGSKKVLICGFIGFMIGSLFAAITRTFGVLLLGRLIQGISAALMAPNAMAVIYHVFPEEQKGMATGIVSSVIAVALAIGPLIGGLLAEYYSWRLIFFVNFPICLTTILLTFKFVEGNYLDNVGSIKRVDLLGVVLLGLFLFCFVAMINLLNKITAQINLFVVLAAVSAISLFLFIFVERKAKFPLIRISLFKNKIISIGCAIRFLFGVPMITLVFVLALYFQKVIGFTSLKTGFVFLPFTIAMIVVSPFVGKYVDKKGYFVPLILGIILCILAYLGFSFPEFDANIYLVLILSGFVGLGVGFVRPSLVTAIMKATPKSQLGLVSSIFTMMNNLGGSFGIAIAGAIINLFLFKGNVQALVSALPIIMYLCISVLMLIMIFVFFWFKKQRCVEVIT